MGISGECLAAVQLLRIASRGFGLREETSLHAVVLSTKRDLPFHEQFLSENEFGDLTREERSATVSQ
jgi:hypothetical protein